MPLFSQLPRPFAKPTPRFGPGRFVRSPGVAPAVLGTPPPASLKRMWKVSSTWCFSDTAGTVPCVLNDPVKAWKCSLTGNLLTQATGAMTPTFKTTYMQFDHSATQFLGPLDLSATFPTACTAAYKVRPGTLTEFNTEVFWSAARDSYYRFDADGLSYPFFCRIARLDARPALPNAAVDTVIVQASATGGWRRVVDGVQDVNDTTVTFESPLAVYVGGQDAVSPRYWEGRVYGLGLCNTALSAAGMIAFGSYLNRVC